MGHFRNFYSTDSILFTNSNSERQWFNSKYRITFQNHIGILVKHFRRTLGYVKTAQNKRKIFGVVPREIALGRYLNQMFTIQGNYKNSARILSLRQPYPPKEPPSDLKASVETGLWIISLFFNNIFHLQYHEIIRIQDYSALDNN